MSDIESTNWSETAASNNATPPNGWPEGMAPSAVNDTARETHGAIKREWNRSHTTISTTGTSTAYVLTYTTAPDAYVNGQRFSGKIDEDCGADATVNVNSLGAKTIKKMTSAGLVNLVAADLKAKHHAEFEYDSAEDAMVLVSPIYTPGFPTGTLMLFQQTAAPTGWTKQTTHNDKALRVVSGTASSGGVSTFTGVFGDKATGAHTLTIAEMPLHGHPYRYSTSRQDDAETGGFLISLPEDANASAFTGTPSATLGRQIGGEGGGGSHTHDLDIDLAYVDIIIAAKD